MYRQHEGETFEDFVIQLKKLAAECEFDALKDSLIKDMLVCGVYDNSLHERMLRDSALTLATAIEAGHAAEETKKHAHELRRQTPSEVNRIEPKFNISRDSHKEADVAKINHRKVERNKANSSKHDYRDDFFENCKFCAGAHKRGNCPAYGKKCRKCKKKNHFEACCSQKSVKGIKDEKVELDWTSSDSDTFYLEMIMQSMRRMQR